MSEAVVGPFVDGDGKPFEAIAAALINGSGYLYGLRREHGKWSVYRWRSSEFSSDAVLVRDGVFARQYAEDLVREDACRRAEDAA